MTTLERLEKLEQDIKMLTTMLGSLPRLQDENASTRLEQVVNTQMQQIHSFNQLLVQRQMSLEQTLTSLAKTISCTVDELENKQVINGHDIMTRLRRLDESAEKGRVQQMLQLKIIKAAETVTEESIIVLSQKIIRDQQEEIIAEYRVVELPAQLTPKEIVASFVGKQVGDTVTETGNGETLISKIENVYELVDSGTLSEEETTKEQVVS